MNGPRRIISIYQLFGALALLATVFGTGCASSEGFNPKQDGRYKRIALTFPLTPFVYGWMGYHILTESRASQEVDFERAIRYDPSDWAQLEGATELDERTRALIRKHAPIIVQEAPEETPYSSSINLIGSPRPFVDAKDRKAIEVDTDNPAIYFFTTTALIQGEERLQLNYVYWFSEHPKMSGGFDPEAGKVEGLTLRITLGRDDEPVFYETIYNCGCYHRVYASESIERRAREEFGEPKGKFHTAVQKKRRFKIDFYSPETVADNPSERLVIFSEAGRHMQLSIRRESDIAGAANVVQERAMAVKPYELLETGACDGLGIFNSDTLVAGADRAESWMLIPTGLYHAGTPRRRGAQLIHFDQYDFDDPQLLEKNLRLPPGM